MRIQIEQAVISRYHAADVRAVCAAVVRLEVARHGARWWSGKTLAVLGGAKSAVVGVARGARVGAVSLPKEPSKELAAVARFAVCVRWQTYVMRGVDPSQFSGLWGAEAERQIVEQLRAAGVEPALLSGGFRAREVLVEVPRAVPALPVSKAAARLLAARKRREQWERRLLLAQRRAARAERELKVLDREIKRHAVAVEREIG